MVGCLKIFVEFMNFKDHLTAVSKKTDTKWNSSTFCGTVPEKGPRREPARGGPAAEQDRRESLPTAPQLLPTKSKHHSETDQKPRRVEPMSTPHVRYFPICVKPTRRYVRELMCTDQARHISGKYRKDGRRQTQTVIRNTEVSHRKCSRDVPGNVQICQQLPTTLCTRAQRQPLCRVGPAIHREGQSGAKRWTLALDE